jgi:hypothetical protein
MLRHLGSAVEPTYTVERGDTLTGIVVKLGLADGPDATNSAASWAPALAMAAQIAQLNGLANVDQLEVGQVLRLPDYSGSSGEHTTPVALGPPTPEPEATVWPYVLGIIGVGLWLTLRRS